MRQCQVLRAARGTQAEPTVQSSLFPRTGGSLLSGEATGLWCGIS